MNATGSQIAKVAIPTTIALTGSGFFGTIIAGAIIIVGTIGVTMFVSETVVEFVRTRGQKRHSKPETA